MKKTLKWAGFTGVMLLAFGLSTACKNKDASVAKIYVRSVNEQLVEGATVVIIGDVDNATTTVEYVDTAVTNSSGFALFNMDAYFEKAGEDNSVGVFDVVVRKGDDEGEATGFRVRVHNTAVKTVYFQ